MPPQPAASPVRDRESAIMHRILLALGQGATRLFRQNVGTGWVGRSQRFTRAEMVLVQPGDVLVRKAQPLQAGLCVGSSDLIGWHSVEVTPEMVGQRVALFTALEVKRAHGGRATPEQVQFVEQVRRAGGRAGIVRSEEEGAAVLSAPLVGSVPPFVD